jgi:DNA-binding transcriptional ArsR family regulator
VLKIFALFGHPIRVVIFQRLARRPTTASVLAQQLPVSRVSVVQHVKRLERAGLLTGTRHGKHRVYRVQPDGLEPLGRWLTIHRTARRAADFNREFSGSGPRSRPRVSPLPKVR